MDGRLVSGNALGQNACIEQTALVWCGGNANETRSRPDP